ncbi:hypothetical protein VP455E521_P0024 [Vibrio phage 455E52-1]|nr:hypothetical protein VP455E521_P0024 [Vibrio phage 455E52-1]
MSKALCKFTCLAEVLVLLFIHSATIRTALYQVESSQQFPSCVIRFRGAGRRMPAITISLLTFA